MNCANHPETPAVSYCQYCGKPLCAECVHKVDNVISCEPCLAARVHAATTGAAYAPGAAYGQGAAYTTTTAAGTLPPGMMRTPAGWGTNPGIALAVGWIPGVGAVYNGQIGKALVHVGVFAILIDLTRYNGLIGLLIPIWVLYQMFDAYQTTEARQKGLPLPNPLGLNDVGHWFAARQQPGVYPGDVSAGNVPPGSVPPGNVAPGYVAPGYVAPGNVGSVPPAGPEVPPYGAQTSGFASGFVHGYPPYAAPVPPMPPMPPTPENADRMWGGYGRGVPTGAIVLIGLGVLFLLGNLGILSQDWLDRGWPIVLIALGVWIVIRRSQNLPPGGVR